MIYRHVRARFDPTILAKVESFDRQSVAIYEDEAVGNDMCVASTTTVAASSNRIAIIRVHQVHALNNARHDDHTSLAQCRDPSCPIHADERRSLCTAVRGMVNQFVSQQQLAEEYGHLLDDSIVQPHRCERCMDVHQKSSSAVCRRRKEVKQACAGLELGWPQHAAALKWALAVATGQGRASGLGGLELARFAARLASLQSSPIVGCWFRGGSRSH